MLPGFASDSIIITEPVWAGERGKQVKTYPAQGSVVSPVIVQDGSASPTFELRDAVEIRKVVFLNPGVSVSRHARITIDGRYYRIYGAPHVWKGPAGIASHIHLDLVDWEG